MDYLLTNIGTTLLSICLLLVYTYFRISHRYWESRGVPQYNPSFPFGDMGSVILRRQNMAEKLKEIYDHARKNGRKYVGIYFFSRKAIMPVDPKLTRDIMANFNDRGLYFDEKNDPLSAHLFSLSGTKWKKLRAKLTPAYSPKQLRMMFGVMLDCGLKLKDVITDSAGSGKSMEIREIIARYTTDVIGSCAFGLECNTMRNPNAEFRLMGKRAFTQTIGDLFRIIIIRSIPQLARILGIGIFSRSVMQFFRRAVTETIEYREKNNIRRDDFLQILIQLKNGCPVELSANVDGGALTMEEAAAQAFIFFLAGFETTSTTISFAIFEMASNKEIQRKARLEVEKVFRKHGDVCSYESVQDLTYLDTILQETLRKYPAAPVFLRKCSENFNLPDSDATIEKDFTVVVPCFAFQRDPEYFPNPELFDPDRFNDENRSKLRDYTYMPFGSGPRACIGMRFALLQMKITLSLLLKHFVFNVCPKTRLPLVMEKKGILLAPIGGLWINFEHAETSNCS